MDTTWSHGSVKLSTFSPPVEKGLPARATPPSKNRLYSGRNYPLKKELMTFQPVVPAAWP